MSSVLGRYEIPELVHNKNSFTDNLVTVIDNINTINGISPTFWPGDAQNIHNRNTACHNPGPASLWEIAQMRGRSSMELWEEEYGTGYTHLNMRMYESPSLNAEQAVWSIPLGVSPTRIHTGYRVWRPGFQSDYLPLNEASILHELGHQFLFDNNIDNSFATQEGIADILSFIVFGSTRIFERDLRDRISVNDVIGGGTHEQGRPLGHWFWQLSQDIGIDEASTLFLDILDLLPEGIDYGYQELMEISIELGIERYGVCSDIFRALIDGWEDIDMDTNSPIANGGACVKQRLTSGRICEENSSFDIQLEGNGGLSGLDDDRNTWTIIGNNSTEFESDLGMQGNIQQGGFALNISNIPEFPYYPQEITVRVYVAELDITITNTYLIEDCDRSGPTCEDFHAINDSGVNEDEFSIGENLLQEKVGEYAYSIYYDMMGNKLDDTKLKLNSFNNNYRIGILIKLNFDINGRLLKSSKVMNSFN